MGVLTGEVIVDAPCLLGLETSLELGSLIMASPGNSFIHVCNIHNLFHNGFTVSYPVYALA